MGQFELNHNNKPWLNSLSPKLSQYLFIPPVSPEVKSIAPVSNVLDFKESNISCLFEVKNCGLSFCSRSKIGNVADAS